MGAPAGNQNAAKAKQWTAAIERAIERLADPSIDPDKPVARTPRMKGMDMLAEEYLTAVRASGFKGFDTMGDRIEGKPTQVIAGDPDNPLAVSVIERVVVDPKA
jgi:hypothetical protein